jgi:hypothetical protein
MNIRRAAAFALLAVTPVTVRAQRGIMGGRGALTPGRGAGTLSREAPIQIPKYVNGVNLLIEHRQDLNLSDSQFVQLIVVKRALDSTNAPLLRKLDSVQRVFKTGTPLFSSPSAQRRDSISEGRRFVAEAMVTIHDNVSNARDRAFAALSSTQLARAQEFEQKAEIAAAEENQRSERSAGRSGSGRPPAT